MMANVVDWMTVRRIAAAIVTVVTVALALWVLDWNALVAAALRIPLDAIALCVLFATISQIVMAIRWSVIAKGAGEAPALREILLSLHSSLFNLITPGGLGADIYRVVQSRSHNRRRSRSAGLVILERLLGIWAQSTIYVVTWLLAWLSASALSPVMHWAGLAFLAGAIVIIALAFGAAPVLHRHARLRTGRLFSLLGELAGSSIDVSLPRRLLILFLSLVAAAFWVAASVVLAAGAGLKLPVTQVAMVTVLTEFARVLPLSVQGVGVREATYAWLAAINGAIPEVAFVVCGVLYALNFLVITVTGSLAAALSMRIAATHEAR